ncbi:transglutaminase-like cysteine peptidase [Novosphingobium flavum]|uniref:Transglutaminase-like cysteine peptidase n=2 Tax=Novosphingobium flavum TaxID=1778672 RepID=A0A7X1FST2_9SPHN|nr:transglutaminase-like cysteine peptidase [Novosphingobium flavum]
MASVQVSDPARCQAVPVAVIPAASSKASAILGGMPSALDRIRQEQAVAPATAALTATQPVNCALPAPAFAQPAPPIATIFALTAPIPGEFLASRRLAVAHTAFDTQWERVSHAALGASAIRRLGFATGGDLESRLRAVNGWTNAHVRYVEDAAQFGRADYWADAGETLRRGAGDCEDIAIVKLQLLAASGVPRDAMFLTIARDLLRHADHALLIVRDGERFWMLDNATDTLVDAGASADYRPVFSFGEHGKWLHGYETRKAVTPVPAPMPITDAPLQIALSPALIDAPAIAAPQIDGAMLGFARFGLGGQRSQKLAFNAR